MTTISYLEEQLEKTNKDLNYYKKYSNRLLNQNKEKDKEIERLNNIINELEKLLENPYNVDCINQNNDFLRRIRELKGE